MIFWNSMFILSFCAGLIFSWPVPMVAFGIGLIGMIVMNIFCHMIDPMRLTLLLAAIVFFMIPFFV